MHWSVVLLQGVLLPFVPSLHGGDRVSDSEPPNVVVFVIDDVADSDIDAVRTPALDRLAAEGMRFRRAYSHAWCAPTRDSLLRSRWLGDLRGDACVPSEESSIDFGEFNLAKLFGAAGYRTAHLGKWHLGANSIGPWELTPHLYGFDDVRAGMPIGECPRPEGQAWTRLDDGKTRPERTHRTIALRDALIEWWSETPGPKFAMVNFLAAHAPFRTPPDSILYPWFRPRKPKGSQGARADWMRMNRTNFEAEILGVDFVLGELMPVLGPDTWILFLGDNGTPGSSRKMPERHAVATRRDQDAERVKLSCYEDGVRVPLIVRAPGLVTNEGSETDGLVHVVDLLPTLAEALGLALLPAVDGESFVPLLSGAEGARGREFVYCHNPTRGDRAIVTQRWKLLLDRTGGEALYDLQADPGESQPLPAEGPTAERLRALREAIVGSEPASSDPVHAIKDEGSAH